MNIDELTQTQLREIFRPLNAVAAANAFPPPATLSETLKKIAPTLTTATPSHNINLTPKYASYFATAAVEMWLRSVHSFLISASLTEVSPIWASVSGYYSSHYSVRALAHLLGYFHLFHESQIIELRHTSGRHVCNFTKKKGGKAGGEHTLYWDLVKDHVVFSADPLFIKNTAGQDASDVGHRNRANYLDHIYQYPNFQPLDKDALKNRIDHISKMVFQAPPIPKVSNFPDVESVQLIAYHRLISFRKLLDEVLGSSNRFWNVHRNPPFATQFMNFQLATGDGIGQINTQ